MSRAATGIEGLDSILDGGLSPGNIFLLEGDPGTGKTTIALRFLLTGAAAGEKGLYITLSETGPELRASAASHGWEIGENITVFEVVPPESLLNGDQQQSLLYASDLELGESINAIRTAFEEVRPTRVVLDSLSEIRLLAQSSLRYRRQILALKHYFARHGATVLLLDDLTSEQHDRTVHSVAHGVIQLEQRSPAYGKERRRVRVLKYRGQAFRGGYHDFVIRHGGVIVYPRLVALYERNEFVRDRRTSEIPALDALLGGGIEQGSSTLLLGPSGTGKTTFAMQFVRSAIARGERAAYFVFDEELGLLISRMAAVGIDLRTMQEEGKLHLVQIDAAEVSPGEFAYRVRKAVEEIDAKTIVIDSLNGYQAAMPEENSLVLHVHELMQYLNRRGANTFLTVAQHGLVGDMRSPVDITYLADTVVLLRYFEARGQVRRAVSVIKKRSGGHESTIREYRFGRAGLQVGEALSDFQGVLKGVPQFVGSVSPLMSGSGDP